jgi:hypothetical protein
MLKLMGCQIKHPLLSKETLNTCSEDVWKALYNALTVYP